jgi:hypothetical protein
MLHQLYGPHALGAVGLAALSEVTKSREPNCCDPSLAVGFSPRRSLNPSLAPSHKRDLAA